MRDLVMIGGVFFCRLPSLPDWRRGCERYSQRGRYWVKKPDFWRMGCKCSVWHMWNQGLDLGSREGHEF